MTRFSRWDRFAARYLLALLFSVTALAGLANAAAPAGVVRIHYHRAAGDYTGWAVYTWNGALHPSPAYPSTHTSDGIDTFGVYFDVAVQPAATFLNFILHAAGGNPKNCNNDMRFDFTPPGAGGDVWQLRDDCTIYTSLPPITPPITVGNVNKAMAHWLTPNTIAWPGADAASTYQLYYAPDGGITSLQSGISGGTAIPLSFSPSGLSAELKSKYPYLASASALQLRAQDVPKVPEILKGQIVVARFSSSGTLLDATSLQIPGVLDSLCTYSGRLGVVIPHRSSSDGTDEDNGGSTRGLQFRVWAPTAKSVNLQVFDSPSLAAPAAQIIPMSWNPDTCVWTAGGDSAWANRKYYKYEVKVFVRLTGKVESNVVTDPYSLGLSVNSQRSLVTDLHSPETMPSGWENETAASGDSAQGSRGPLSTYELHIRDFSASDASVPAPDQGKFLAFTDQNSRGMMHLRELARAGLTYVHLLPSFDFATVPEDGCVTPAIPNAGPASTLQQAAIAPVRDQDCFNWGYDPWHYTVPEGSYASDANGVARIREYRAMVKGLHDAGLKVVMDVVYNHTTASGQDPKSVLDRIVPGYYQRLDAVGNVLSDSCCSDTAAEHAMFEKLMIDSTEVWTREYHVDAFRFDLMSFHPKSTMLKLRANLQRFNPDVYIYGEGWNFGAVGNDARFVQATQLNLAGTGIGTFSDRLRDAVRGGGPFDSGDDFVRNQGFINGLWYDNNALAGAQSAGQKATLLHLKDLIMLGLAGNLRDYPLVDSSDGVLKTGFQFDYFGQHAAYTGEPRENIVYASVHDGQTLFDISQYKLPMGTSLADRVRAQTLGLGLITLAEGVSFIHGGDDMLRSKSFDNNSFNSGDWFNRIDFTYQTNNWGVGLPPAWGSNDGNWSVMTPFLSNPALAPGFAEIDQARRNLLDLLAIRNSSPLLNLTTAADVIERVRFYDTGPGQSNPALIVMALAGEGGHGARDGLIVFFNADKQAVAYVPRTGGQADYAGTQVRLHPVQRNGADDTVKTSSFDSATGTFQIPARTTAVFVVGRHDD